MMGLDNTCMKENILEMVENHKQTGGDHYAFLYNEKNRWDTQNTMDKDGLEVSGWFDYIIMNELDHQLKNRSNPEKLKFIINEKKKFYKCYKGEHGKKLISYFEDFKDEIRFEIETNKKETKPKPEKQITYQWFGKPDIDLPELYNELINNNLILNDISPDDFKAIFIGQPIENIKQPIKWHDNNASELLYFIIQLMTNLIEPENRIDYQRLKACFVNSDGKTFKTDFRTLKAKLSINLSQNKQNVIDRIIDNLT